jgi:hypothetical protein
MEKLIANEGMVLTNGEAFGRVVFLGTGDSADNWHEITEAEYEALMEKDNTATEEDYQDALREMGVKV